MLKKLKIGAVVVLALGLLTGGYLGAAHLSGGSYYSFGLPLGGDRGALRRISTSFLEDVQFKDFKKAASYHRPEMQDTVDIPFLLERLFMQKPELIDITRSEIMFVDVDSSGLRARLRCQVNILDLVQSKPRKQQFMLFFHRDTLDSGWYMELESSLRTLDADQTKEH
jgi:hypothetical protein